MVRRGRVCGLLRTLYSVRSRDVPPPASDPDASSSVPVVVPGLRAAGGDVTPAAALPRGPRLLTRGDRPRLRHAGAGGPRRPPRRRAGRRPLARPGTLPGGVRLRRRRTAPALA